MRRDRTTETRRVGWPFGLIGMAGMVLAVELYVARHDHNFTTVWASAWDFSGRAATREGGKAEILCLGDSLIKYGVAPRVVRAVSGRSAYNFAVCNGQAPTNFFLLRRALASGGRPAAVLVDGEVLEHDPRTHTRMWADLLGAGESLELAWEARDDFLIYGYLKAINGHLDDIRALRSKLAECEALGPIALGVARRVHALSRRHPRLARVAKRLIRRVA